MIYHILILTCASCFQSRDKAIELHCQGLGVLSELGRGAAVNVIVWLLLVLQDKASLLLSTRYRQACFMIQHSFFFFWESRTMIFEVLYGMAVIHDGGFSMFKKLISGFHLSLVDLNICVRKETGRGECCGKELFAHTQRIELILWLGRFYTFPCLPFPSNFLPIPVCYQC